MTSLGDRELLPAEDAKGISLGEGDLVVTHDDPSLTEDSSVSPIAHVS